MVEKSDAVPLRIEVSCDPGAHDSATYFLVELLPTESVTGIDVPLDLIALVDLRRSARRRDTAALTHAAFRELESSLSNSDRLGVIGFSGISNVLLPLTLVGTLRESGSLRGLLDKHGVGTESRMVFGLRRAEELLQEVGRSNALKRIYCFVDGLVADLEDCRRVAREMSAAGIEVSVYGLGRTPDVAQVAALSTSSEQRHTGVFDKPDDLSATLRRSVVTARSVLVSHAELQIDFRDEVVRGSAFQYRPIELEMEQSEDATFQFNVPTFEVGTSYSYCSRCGCLRKTNVSTNGATPC